MNDFVEQLKRRRSIRKYQNKMPDDEILREIAEAGTYAPSGMNRQPCIIVIIKNKDIIQRLEKLNREIANRDYNQFFDAPVLMVVLADRNVKTKVFDGSLVASNILNAADALGLGACWINRAKEVFETEEGKQILQEMGINGDYEGVANCIIGYIDGEYPEPAPRRENTIFFVN